MAGKKWIILSTDGLNKEGEERRCMAKKIDKYCDQGFGYKEKLCWLIKSVSVRWKYFSKKYLYHRNYRIILSLSCMFLISSKLRISNKWLSNYWTKPPLTWYDGKDKTGQKYNKEVKTEHKMVEISITIYRDSNDFLKMEEYHKVNWLHKSHFPN